MASLVEAANELRDDPDVRFVFVGEGAHKARAIARARELGLQNVVFLPGQPRGDMNGWYVAGDVLLVPLRKAPVFEHFIPSKIFEIMACARPMVGSVSGEARGILERSAAALVVPPEDAAAIGAAIRQLKADPDRRARMGSAGRHYVAEHYDRAVLAKRYLEMLEQIVADARVSAAVPGASVR
jgi:glycosyltransferase involved in cell wall biosynthesis